MHDQIVFDLLKKIPKGKVTTYKKLALKAGLSNSRLVGKIIHTNPNPSLYPCHRVVKSDGKLAEGYAFGGKIAQKKLLESEGIIFENDGIDLTKFEVVL